MKPRRVLIANRGEIATRIIRALREMGMAPVTVYSTADRMSRHVSLSDAAICIGDGPSIHSYLDIDAVIRAAKTLKADAIHPGYGFLSEKAEFAKAVSDAGIVFIGPKPDSISSMGDKVMARTTMERAGLPLIPGTKEAISDEAVALKEAKRIGFPVMIKALAGGGGRGMRLVEQEPEFLSLFRRAFSEAQKAFGDGRLYLEKYVSSPHHIEVQVIADSHGNICHLFERECSVQRRHQKVIEESLSPFISQATRQKLCQAAVDAVKKVGYLNAGTIEFLVDDKENFYFMEMNTRLQVEHPVTEWITGIDLVKEQVNIAFGGKLSFGQEEVKTRGHAIEFRINAEDPEKFLPQAGRLTGVSFPRGSGVRIDSHVYRGYEIPVFYDSMIAKISVWGRTRMEAIERSRAAMRECMLNGIKTNVALHLQILEHPKFIEGHYTTRFIGDDFQYQPPKVSKAETREAMITAAVAAFQKEFRINPQTTDGVQWRAVAREEALR